MRIAAVALGILLTVAIYVSASMEKRADALTSGSAGQWEYVRGRIDAFISTQAQYAQYGNNGEAGFTIDRDALRGRIDSNGNMNLTTGVGVLGEGDDAANAPVLVDNLITTANVIPGTSVRCNWSGGYGNTTAPNCFDVGKVNEIAARVNAHEAAGFSTDIVVYCATGRTESATVGGLGPLAHTGALGGSTPPRVLAFKWGRNGWSGTTTTTTATTGATGAGVAPPSVTWNSLATNASKCDTYGVNSNAVRCAAQWALYNGTGDTAWGGNGYNMGNGLTAVTSSNLLIDVRTPTPGTTATPSATGGPTTVKIRPQHMFSSELNYLAKRSSTTKNVFIGRTMHLPGIISTGAVMLGYESSFYVWGVNSWNTSLGGESWQTGNWNGSGTAPTAYPLPAATASNHTSGVDQAAPTQSGIGAGSITANSAVISRTASEPATMKVQYGTTPGGPYTSTVNNTVLNASKSVTLSGLSENTTYYYKVTSYDGQANASATSAEMSFTTPDVTAPVITNNQPTGVINTASAVFSVDYSDVGGSGINPATAMIHFDGPMIPGCTATATGISCTKSGMTVGTHNLLAMVNDNAGNYAELAWQVTVADATAPTVSNIQPSGNVASDSTTVSASFADAAPSSGINPATASLTVSGATVSGCSASASGISCTASGMGVGSHTIDVSVSDNAGNSSGVQSGSFTVVDSASPSVSYGGPSGTISDSSPTVTGSATDGSPSSGLSSASLSLNGGASSACAIDGGGNVSCATSGLADGDYEAVISVTDGAGNTGTASGNFTVNTVPPCVPGKPSLGLSKGAAYWQNMAAYLARTLSLPVTLKNNGTETAFAVAISNTTTATNGVLFVSASPVGDISGGASAGSTIVYYVPPGVGSFKTNIKASAEDGCGTGYTYP
ncbi:MAG: hypothetical protein C4534_11270 [Gaiellales bacterium]|nr:MAG: hypothetical protein C4534_11270 [Gaiellales bacterium]